MITLCTMRRVHEGLSTLLRYSDQFYEGKVGHEDGEIVASGPLPTEMDHSDVRHLEKLGWTWRSPYWRFKR
jgi:hypothetical protein